MQEDIVALERFMHTVEWLLAIYERNPNALPCGMIHVCFHNKQQLGQTYGARDALMMLAELSGKMRKTFRKTDLVGRDGSDFWILVPYTSPDAVAQKVSLLVEIASDAGLDIVDRDIAVFSLPEPEIMQNKVFNSAVEFLEHLKANRQVAYHWEQVVQAS